MNDFDMKQVCRYVPLERFEDVVEKKALFLVNPFVSWKDQNEGFLFRFAKDARKTDEFENLVKQLSLKAGKEKNIIDQIVKGNVTNEIGGEALDWFGMRCQSWSWAIDDPKMWELYSYENCSICFITNTQKLRSLRYRESPVEGFNVIYTKELEVDDVLEKSVRKGGDMFLFPEILQYKQKSFSNENEYRIYTIERNHQNHGGIDVPIDEPIYTFIEGAICHPKAPKEFQTIVKDYCVKNKIVYRESGLHNIS